MLIRRRDAADDAVQAAVGGRLREVDTKRRTAQLHEYGRPGHIPLRFGPDLDAEMRRLETQYVEIEYTPLEYRWDFGDGGSTSTSSAGVPYPDLIGAVLRTYEWSGWFIVGLEADYSARWRLEGTEEPWTALAPVTGSYQHDYEVWQRITVILR